MILNKFKRRGGLLAKKAKQPAATLMDDPFQVDDPFEPTGNAAVQSNNAQVLQAPHYDVRQQPPDEGSSQTPGQGTGNRWGNPPLPPSLNKRA